MQAPSRRALFRADASPAIGGGHVMRCLTLANELARRGWECRFASVGETTRTVPAAFFADHEIHRLPADAAADPDRLPDGDWDLLVVDHYGLDAEYECRVRNRAGTVLVLDDLADRPHDCDLLLDQNFGRRGEDYRSLVPGNARVMAGPAYALLRPAFARLRPQRLAALDRPAEKVAVSMGLGDADGAVLTVIEGFAKCSVPMVAEIVIAAEAAHYAEAKERAASLGSGVRLHTRVDDMAALLAGCDIAIGAGGGTSWERCCLALPTILIPIADNQLPGSRALAAAGAVHLVDRGAELSADTVAKALDRLVLEDDYRLAMAKLAAGICDGIGVRRVVQALDPPRARDGGAVMLRPATGADGDLLLEWQSHPGVRRHFRNPAVPTPEEHFRWLESKLSDPGCLFNIIQHDSRPAGVVRLDRTGPTAFEVSILAAPGSERLGLARAGLLLARDLVPDSSLVAEVLPANVAAQNLFRSAGYKEISPGHFEQPNMDAAA